MSCCDANMVRGFMSYTTKFGGGSKRSGLLFLLFLAFEDAFDLFHERFLWRGAVNDVSGFSKFDVAHGEVSL